MSDEEAVRVAGRLTKAQRRAVIMATWSEQDGVWHPEGWYACGDRRVRSALCRAKLTRDYLRHSNRLTPFGVSVRAILKDSPNV